MPDTTYNNQNIFAKILRSELPCIKVYEDDHAIAFIDIIPQADGHVLMLPREGATELFDLPDDATSAAVRTTHKLVRAMRAASTPPGTAIFQLNGSAAGQTVPHMHFHMLPRYSDTPLQLHARVQASNGKLKAQTGKVIAALQAE